MNRKQLSNQSSARTKLFTAIFGAAAIIGVALAVLWLLPKIRNHSKNTVRIGVLAPISGFMSGHGGSIEEGARLAEDSINGSGGILGRKVELIVLDTKSDPAVAAERAKELIGRDDVDLIIGTGTSAESLAVIPDAERSATPFLYSLDGEDKTCQSGNKAHGAQWIWGTGFTERMVVKPLLQALAERVAPSKRPLKVYFLGGDYVYPRTTNAYAEQVATSLGYSVIGDEYSDTATQDYAPVIRRIEAAKPDLLIVTNPGTSGVTFMSQAKQIGLDKTIAISGFATFDQEALDAMGSNSEGVYCVNRYSRGLSNQANRTFVEHFRARYPNETTLPGPTAAAGSYGALLVVKAAYEKAGTFDRLAFAHSMDGLEVSLPQGVIHVNPKNHIFDQPIYIMQIRHGEYEVVKTVPSTSHPGFDGCSVQ